MSSTPGSAPPGRPPAPGPTSTGCSPRPRCSFWLSTVRTDGRPHVTPIPAIRSGGARHICTGPGEQKAVNLAALWKSRLNWDFHVSGEGFDGAPVYALHPTKILAFGKGSTCTQTRYRFPS